MEDVFAVAVENAFQLDAAKDVVFGGEEEIEDAVEVFGLRESGVDPADDGAVPDAEEFALGGFAGEVEGPEDFAFFDLDEDFVFGEAGKGADGFGAEKWALEGEAEAFVCEEV